MDPDQTVPKYVQDHVTYNLAQIASLAEDTSTSSTGANNRTETEESAAVAIDAQGNTAEDPIILNESTSSSDNDSTEAEDKTN